MAHWPSLNYKNGMVGGWWSFLAPIHSGCSESASLGDAGGPFGTKCQRTKGNEIQSWHEGKACGCVNTHYVVIEAPKTAAEVSLFSRLLTVTSVDTAVIIAH